MTTARRVQASRSISAKRATSDSATDLDREARRQAANQVGLVWHVGTFVIINAAFWLLDAFGPGGLDWAHWVTATWGLALAFHLLAFWIDGRNLEDRLARQLRERDRDPDP